MAAPPVALAVIGVDDRPLYLEIAQEGGEENLGLHFVLHCALDFVDEKLANMSKRSAPPPNPYLGVVYPTDEYRVYAYVNTTGIKFLIMTEMERQVKEADLLRAFETMQSAYTDAVSNPFYNFGEKLTSKRFCSAMEKIACSAI
mmetsp:Transcript_1577/g.9721  ORF Transcript_1577/g.9721 Transcript_1577/m.9721 type:complete len:144 (+) Transcript_1577:95-526(+)|eukprot:CAMPEP_0113927440 /NCGR_PEP_ID=MMETSP1159-20121227/4305_1 /TAXON_ID=88271 /ORGANISM="Picocystis salinarum" /LENGTH=143 /DNA_ID=CAMNT_0000927931 /DNA_START=52 /DNA_END=483 /DNA_ORIENTATION=- /assembly_acc=CAM_ASM_000767